MRNILHKAVTLLQTKYCGVFNDVYQQSMLVPVPQVSTVNKFAEYLQRTFSTRDVADIMSRYTEAKQARLNRVAQIQESYRLAEERERPQFNANHTPLLLVIYTHHTPYPTAAERLAIAEYTHMTERQIEVWFQNHRRVQKKAGFPPSRVRGPSGGVEKLIASLPPPSYSQPTPEPEQHPDEDPQKSPPSSDLIPIPTPIPNGKGKGKEASPSFLRPVPYPAHAFHFDVPWPRIASTTPITKTPPTTMDELTQMFTRMNVRSASQEHEGEGEAATARYTTDLRGRSAAYVGEGAWKTWSWSWHGRSGLLSVEWGKSSWGKKRKTRANWKPYSKPQQLPRRTPSPRVPSSSSRRTASSGSSSSSSSSSSRSPSWGSQTEAPCSPASSYTSYSPSPSPPPGTIESDRAEVMEGRIPVRFLGLAMGKGDLTVELLSKHMLYYYYLLILKDSEHELYYAAFADVANAIARLCGQKEAPKRFWLDRRSSSSKRRSFSHPAASRPDVANVIGNKEDWEWEWAICETDEPDDGKDIRKKIDVSWIRTVVPIEIVRKRVIRLKDAQKTVTQLCGYMRQILQVQYDRILNLALQFRDGFKYHFPLPDNYEDVSGVGVFCAAEQSRREKELDLIQEALTEGDILEVTDAGPVWDSSE
ncbi:uncharacterized protein EV420DRAFT_1475697 [Desarmillaria tabescens]|uniref:Homeobox domain-containing protein n=1 Tax=Armillaria tabescens TaxID=1929756 RepID=A0AA39U296_ARMTA|nr:uncharacterized protein EV420DRAFT_1475697 [Desarmillaria tabescens]KAK0465615.1 hypothetical protein EV420DRAFT_1475697 [Desarmillaria tabescens]